MGADLTLVGTGTLTLTGSNTYSGSTTINGGTLNLSNALALQNSTLATGGAGIVFDQSVATHAFTVGGLGGSANLILADNASPPNAVALSVGNNNANTNYAGIISGSGSLIKIGSGMLTLTAASPSAYSGGTTISQGTLAIGAYNCLPSNGPITVGNGVCVAYQCGKQQHANRQQHGHHARRRHAGRRRREPGVEWAWPIL